ncbi:MAG: hypothetical protein PHP46_04640 [Candidatus Omnitrophica bacterium]|nr:hypothetical protein [Candidatus Omnitrophota bacterium]
MGSRTKSVKRESIHTANSDFFIERLKKIRALNGDPSLVGMERYVLKKMPFNKLSILTKSL